MFSFTKRADYALLALSYLTAAAYDNPDRLVNTKEIAEQFHMPAELLAKIMQILAKHDLVASFPGPTGGYKLLKNPANISIAEVVYIVDGQLGITQCSGGNGSGCEQFSRCTIRNPLAEIETRMNGLLQQMSIREITTIEPAYKRVPGRTLAVMSE